MLLATEHLQPHILQTTGYFPTQTFSSLFWNPYHLSGLMQCLLHIFHCSTVSDSPFQHRLKGHEGPHCLGKECLISEHPGAISDVHWAVPVLGVRGHKCFHCWLKYSSRLLDPYKKRQNTWRAYTFLQTSLQKNTASNSFCSPTAFWMLYYHVRSLNLQLKTAAIWLTHALVLGPK